MRLATLALLLSACGCAPAPAEPAAVSVKSAPTAPDAAAAEAMAEAPTGWQTFGEPFGVSEAVMASTVLDAPADFLGKKLTVEGRVADVCQKAGCWMVVTDGSARTMRVRMKDHGFAVAKDATGATARVHGEVVAKRVDPKEVAHFEGEAAKPEVMPEGDLAAGTTTYELVASAVQIKR